MKIVRFAILLLCVCLLWFSVGCDVNMYKGRYPTDYGGKWVCQNADMYFDVDSNEYIFSVNGESILFKFLFASNSNWVIVYKPDSPDDYTYKREKYLFDGYCKVGKNKFEIKVTEPNDYFHDVPITLVFLKEKNGD